MRLVTLCVVCLLGCGGDSVVERPGVFVGPPTKEVYCGDGICQSWLNEDETWCEDCLPPEEAYCGDGECQDWEDYLTCKADCDIAQQWHNGTPQEPGYSDPVDPPWRNNGF